MADWAFTPNLLAAVAQASHIVVLTGAGISAESGIPTFREAQTGLWAKYDPQELATPQAFRRNPRLVWEWYAWRRQLVSQAKPNAGHKILAQWQARAEHFTLITQNVDSLHQQAGSQNVIELHGNIMRTKCFDHGHVVNAWPETEDVPPTCPVCGSLLRPDVVWFGENLPQQALATAVSAARTCDIFLAIGTSALVHPAAALPLEALEQGIPVVEINPRRTGLTPYADHVLAGPAGEVLPALAAQLAGFT